MVQVLWQCCARRLMHARVRLAHGARERRSDDELKLLELRLELAGKHLDLPLARRVQRRVAQLPLQQRLQW